MRNLLLMLTAFACAWPAGCGAPRGDAAGVDTGYVRAGSAELFYESSGEGRPVVLVHGGMLDHTMWDPQMRDLTARYRVVRYDARRHGRSRSEPDTFSHHEDLRQLVDALGLSRPAVIGLSMGGYAAIDFALEYPDRVSALVLVGPGLSGYEFHGEEFERYLVEFRAAAEAGDPDAIVEAFIRGWTDGPRRRADEVDPAVREHVRRSGLRNVTGWDPSVVEYRPLPPAIERLDSLPVPVLAVVGDLDMPGIVEIVDMIFAGAPDARKVVIPGAAHMVSMEKPGEFNRIVLEFLEEVYPPAAGK